MRKFVAVAAMAVAVAVTGVVNAADIKSGLQVGDGPPAFTVLDITGPSAGQKLCYRCQYSDRPVVSIFARKMDESVVKLVKELDNVVVKNSDDKKMAAFVTVLTNNPDAAEGELKKIADTQQLKRTPLTVFENNAGPAKYKIDEKAEVTVMMWVDADVKVNHAFAAGELTAENIAKVVADTKKILN